MEEKVAYNTNLKALDQLLGLKRLGAKIWRSPDTISTLSNGLSYYTVEVTIGDGISYTIQAYGEEAIQLFLESNFNPLEPSPGHPCIQMHPGSISVYHH